MSDCLRREAVRDGTPAQSPGDSATANGPEEPLTLVDVMERHHIWIADSGQRTGLMRYAFAQYPASHRVLGRATEREG